MDGPTTEVESRAKPPTPSLKILPNILEAMAGPEHIFVDYSYTECYYCCAVDAQTNRGIYFVFWPSIHYICPGADNCERIQQWGKPKLKYLTLDECYIKWQALSHHMTLEITVWKVDTHTDSESKWCTEYDLQLNNEIFWGLTAKFRSWNTHHLTEAIPNLCSCLPWITLSYSRGGEADRAGRMGAESGPGRRGTTGQQVLLMIKDRFRRAGSPKADL